MCISWGDLGTLLAFSNRDTILLYSRKQHCFCVWIVILELYFCIKNFEFSFLWHFYILIRNYLQMYPGDNTSLGCQDVGHCCQHSFLRALLIKMTIWQHNQLLLWSSNHFQYCTSTFFLFSLNALCMLYHHIFYQILVAHSMSTKMFLLGFHYCIHYF